jgi:Protein of unknown function DUF262
MTSIDDLQFLARERTVKTTSVDYDLETLVRKIDRKSIKLDPEYQRNHKWDITTSSKLIESLILNIPIPLIYISQDVDVDEESEDPLYSVIDGQQRLRAIYDYMKDKYSLKGLEILSAINGLRYSQLPPFLFRRLEDRTIRCLRIDSSSDAQVKFDIFERLNSGSVKLTAQELRNATIRGPFNDFIKTLADNDHFKMMTNESDTSKRVKGMYNIELVLRLLSLGHRQYEYMHGNMGEFLTLSMEKKSMEFSPWDYDLLKIDFDRVMHVCYESFGKHAFARRVKDKVVSPFNVAVYDSLSISVYDLGIDRISEIGINLFIGLFNDDDFQKTITAGINDKAKLIYRIRRTSEALR